MLAKRSNQENLKNDFINSTWKSDPMGISCEMTTRLGGELQQPITGITFG